MKKELLYFAAIFTGIILLTLAIFGFNNINQEATFDFTINNTDLSIPARFIMICFATLLTTGAYFVRLLFTRFQATWANYIFLFFNAALILCIFLMINYLGEFEATIQEKMLQTKMKEMASSSSKAVSNLVESTYFMLALAIFMGVFVIFKINKAKNVTYSE